MNIVSPDITTFDFLVLYDLSNLTPRVTLTNQSQGVNLPGCQFLFIAKTSSNIAYHTGDWIAPDATGAWTSFQLPQPILQVQSHIEWSGSEFTLIGFVKDSTGQIFGPLEKRVTICRPNGNEGAANNFGGGKIDVRVLCEQGRVYFEDLSDYSYRGLPGDTISKVMKLIYPADTTGTAPTPFQLANFNSGLIPVWFSAEGYQMLSETIMRYTFAGGVSVQIKYKWKKYFPIQCNIDLCKLSCDVNRLAEDMLKNGCDAETREKLLLANFKLTQALIGKYQPTCGIDVPKLVEQIKELVGSECDCIVRDGIHQLTAVQVVGGPAGACAIPGSVTGQVV